MSEVLHIVIAIILILALDLLWIWKIMGPIYKKTVQKVQRGTPMKPQVMFAILAYVFLALSIAMIIHGFHALNLPRYKIALISACWGALIYGVYAFTVLSIFSEFPVATALLDIVWGAILFTVAIVVPTFLLKS